MYTSHLPYRVRLLSNIACNSLLVGKNHATDYLKKVCKKFIKSVF